MPELRPYQSAVVSSSREHVRRLLATSDHTPAVLIVVPTGGGKTVCFAEVARSSAAMGKRSIVVAHRRELLRQAGQKLAAAGVPHGFLAPGFAKDTSASCQVASVASAAAALRKDPNDPRYTGYDIIHIDEAHHSVSAGYRAIIAANPKAVVLGWTASPQRLDGKGLGRSVGGMFDALVVGPSIAELTAAGHLCPARVFAPADAARGPDLKGVGRRGGDYAIGDLAARMSSPKLVGDAVAHYRKFADGRPALAFCASVAHAETIAAAFRAAGYRAVSAHGETPERERDAAMSGLETGVVQVLCTCDLVSEGLDVPGVECAILLRPTQSLVLHVQQVGRVLRVASRKEFAIILDHAGNSARHGLPDQDRAWSLDGRTKRDRTARAIRQCTECYAVHRPAPACTCCGFVYPVEAKRSRALRTVAGDLVEMTKADRERAHKKAREDRITRMALAIYGRDVVELAREAKTMSDFMALEKALGCRHGWAHIQYTAHIQGKLRPETLAGLNARWKSEPGFSVSPHVTPLSENTAYQSGNAERETGNANHGQVIPALSPAVYGKTPRIPPMLYGKPLGVDRGFPAILPRWRPLPPVDKLALSKP